MTPQHHAVEPIFAETDGRGPDDGTEDRAWFGDPLFSVGFGLWLVTLILVLAPFIPSEFRYEFSDLWADFTTLPFLLLLALLNARRAPGRTETRFWSLFVAALGTWLVVRVMYVAWPAESWGLAEDVATDVLYGFFYLMLALALETKPHGVPEEHGDSAVLRRSGDEVPILTTVIFFAATVTYFVVLPARQNPEGYRYWLFSFGLYVVLDLYLFGRVLALGHHVRGIWGNVYKWLAALFILWALTDSAEGLLYAEMLPWIEPGTLYDIIWYMPGLAFLIALRTRWWPRTAA